MRLIKYVLMFLFCVAFVPVVSAVKLDASKELQAITSELIKNKTYTRQELKALINPIKINQRVLKLFSRQYEAKPWHQYKKIFLTPDRIQAGQEFLIKHNDLFTQVQDEYGVPKEIVCALLGVETNYGTNKGSFSVLRSLVTLSAAYPRRATFFSKELSTFLDLLKSEDLHAKDMEGSYAGAIGIPQFMPTSYKAYAVDFNHNGRRDLVNELEDAIGSVANYLTVHGWQRGAPISTWLSAKPNAQTLKLINKRAKPVHAAVKLRQLGVETEGADTTKVSLNRLNEVDGVKYFVGYKNFYALTRYNPSNKYAMAIIELAQLIKGDSS